MRNSGMGRHCESLGWEDTSLPLSRAIVWTHLFSSFYPGKQPAYQEHPPAATRSGRSLATPFARPQGHAARGTCGLQCVRGMCPHDRIAIGTNEPATRRSFFFPILSFCSLVVASIWRRYARSLFQLRSTIRLLMV